MMNRIKDADWLCWSASFGLSVFKVVEGICLAHWMLQIQKTAEHVSAPQQEMY